MMRYTVPSHPRLCRTAYTHFRGVDFCADPTQVDATRGARGTVNLLADAGGFPEKRPGWRVLHQLTGKVYGLYRASIDGTEHLLIHCGNKLYSWTENTMTLLYTGLTGTAGTAFAMHDRLYLLTGAEYMFYNGVEARKVSDYAYIPTTSIGRTPAGGGTALEAVNMLTTKRKNSFCGDGTSTVYYLDTNPVNQLLEVQVNGVVQAQDTYQLDSLGGRVAFTTAPSSPPVTGEDNVVITFTKQVDAYDGRVEHCTIAGVYGGAGGECVFVGGNARYPNTDWRCATGDPTYFPDLNYTRVGADNVPIVGYCSLGDAQAIVKKDDHAEVSVFVRRYGTDENGTVVFPVERGVSGIGAIAPRAFGYLQGEPLFLSRSGVYALTTSELGGRYETRSRSHFVNPLLTRETDLQTANAVTWRGCYVLCVGGHCYLLDGKQDRVYQSQNAGDFVYECYYWDNIPATALLEWQDSLYFGTQDGKLCKLNTDQTHMSAYRDGAGQAVCAAWYTKADDDGDFMRYKLLRRRGSGVLAKPYIRSSVRVLARTERDFGREICASYADVFSWEDIDFSRFTFNANDGPAVLPFRERVRRYQTLQLIVRNDALDEGFGIFGLVKQFSFGHTVR